MYETPLGRSDGDTRPAEALAISEDSIRLRYMQSLKLDERTAHTRFLRICFVDYDRELALVAESPKLAAAVLPGDRPGATIMAVGRLSRDRVSSPDGTFRAEFSLLVGDPWQGRGVGRELLGRLVETWPAVLSKPVVLHEARHRCVANQGVFSDTFTWCTTPSPRSAFS